MDTNVNNYSIPDLIAILGLADDSGDFEKACDNYIDKFKKNGNNRMANFFKDVKQRLKDYTTNTDTNQNTTVAQQTDDWITNEVLDPNNPVEKTKITDRAHATVDVYKSDHDSMKKKQLGVNNTYQVPVIQDVLNPNLKNVTERFVNIDSQYRQSGSVSTNFTMDLSDHLNDTLSIRLFSYQIPFTWYNIDAANANNSFWILDGSNQILIAIESGNYDPDSLVAALNTSIVDAGFSNVPHTADWKPVTYNKITGKITMQLYGAIYTSVDTTFTVSTFTQLVFFDTTFSVPNNFIDQTLGWIMGYQLPYVYVAESPPGNTGTAVVDLNGTKYILVVLDDFNQNRINNGLVGITELSKSLKLPSYYSVDMPFVVVPANPTGSNMQSNMNSLTAGQSASNTNAGELLMEKTNATYSAYPQYQPSAPRTLTQSQIYTINQIMKNNDNTTNYRSSSPTNTDVLAVIPVKGGLKFGHLNIELSGSLQSFKRTYFGPVNIDRLQVTLLDDKGNVLNLNGCEWSILLILETLYQY